MASEYARALFIGLAVGLAAALARRLVRGPRERAPAGAALCRAMLLVGWAGWLVFALGCAAMLYLVAPPLALLGAVALAVHLYRRRGDYAGTACGSARWADAEDLLAAGAFDGKSGLIVGRVPPPPLRAAARMLLRHPAHAAGAVRVFLAALTRRQLWVRLPKVVHAAVLSPTGAGKTTAFAITHILTDPDSAVVIDPAGEIHKATAGRRRAMGHEVRVLDPGGVTGLPSDALNAMAGLHPDDPNFIDLCFALAEALVVKTGREEDPHWVESAAMFIGTVIVWVAFFTTRKGSRDLCNLQPVADILADKDEFATCVAMMKKETTALGGLLPRLAHKLEHAVDRERGSIFSTIARTLQFLDAPAVAAVTGQSTFDPAELRNRKVTVYLVVRPDHIREKAGLVRAWLTAFLRAGVRGGTSGGIVHYVLDEYAALGTKLQCVEDALTQYRKFGVRLHFYLQGVGQLEQCFGPGMDKTFMANVTQVFLGVNDLDTAQYVSERLDKTTVLTAGGSEDRSWSTSSDTQGMQNSSSSGSSGGSLSEIERPLLTAGEVCNLGDRVAVTFAPSLPPLWTHVVRFFEPAFRGARGPSAVREAAAGLLCAAFMVVGAAVGGLSAGAVVFGFSAGRPAPQVPAKGSWPPAERPPGHPASGFPKGGKYGR